MTASAGNPKPDPRVLLEELRTEPWDWPPSDIEKVLALWNFTSNPDYKSVWGEQHFVHPDYIDLDVTLPMNDQRVHPAIVEHAVRMIDRVIERTGAGRTR